MSNSTKSTKVGFVSLGCPKNLVDSEVMMGILAREGYELTPRADEAEVLVVNTCSFIEPAQKESVEAIIEMAEHKKFGAARRLIVAGCLVERYRNEIMKQIPEVDAVVGTGEVEKILDAVRGGDATKGNGTAHAGASDYLYHDLTPRMLTTPRHAAYIKIAEGCDHPCAFCIIPQLRGKFRSRRFESVAREAEQLARAGVREVTLIGQDTTSYGEDLGLRDGLPQLLARLAQIEELAWVRFLYAYPNRVTQQLLETLATHDRLVKYLDMPLQHASRDVLASMKRGSNGEAFLKLLEHVRKTIPGVSLRTSFIVGFPGETDSDFRELCDFVRAAEFDWMGVFTYSDVDTAASFHLGAKVAEEVKTDRRDRLMCLQRKISARNLKSRVGAIETALLEGASSESELVWEARLQGMAPDIDGKVYVNDVASLDPGAVAGRIPQPGDLVRIEITESHDYDLVGRILDVVRPAVRCDAAASAAATMPAHVSVQRIATGAPLRVLQ
ncbi:MAG TPA: 30S ribosomal protein S12 methylthiotransferase RimO [Candidatus Acidoferrum sp.]|nr:30S ribosomal protein S12 methylthiotransferase RimO [Candidatus Acidoferrum sp.]